MDESGTILRDLVYTVGPIVLLVVALALTVKKVAQSKDQKIKELEQRIRTIEKGKEQQ